MPSHLSPITVSENMKSPHEEVRKALAVLESDQLLHPSASLICSFVTEAVDSRAAANFVINTLPQQGASLLVSGVL